MSPLFKKLNFKNHKAISVLNAPISFELEMTIMANETSIFTDEKKLDSY
ncbi:hypothetical protein [Flavobacterium polysaccharolyticum]|uniref:Uncharacterized protein n=1 Tax=Flavobacterium polysaccharolyticum TaxID=3133148 RepID=A0ABU9NVE3_9FLAO